MNTPDVVTGWDKHERGVSPVIAVILMVAITVILSAVIATFVLDIGGSLSESPPQATFDTEQNTVTKQSDGEFEFTVVNITHVGGEAIPEETIRVAVNGDEGFGYRGNNNLNADTLWRGSGEIAAGDQISVIAGADVNPDDGPYVYDIRPESSLDSVAFQNKNTGTELQGNVQLQQGEVVRIIYESPDGTSQILYEYEVK